MTRFPFRIKLLISTGIQLLAGGVVCFLIGAAPEPSAIEVKAQVDRNQITVGDLLTLKIQALSSPETIVKFPGPDPGVGSFDIRDYRVDEPRETEDGRVLSQATYILTAFETGDQVIPSFRVRYLLSAQGEEKEAETDPISVVVASVLSDDAADIADIKPPLDMPREWLSLAVAVLAGALIASAAAGLWYYFYRRRKKNGRPTRSIEPTLPPYQVALASLNRLKESRLIEKGEIPRFHVEISEIIRSYFEGRFGIEALEMTSGEVLGALADRKLENSLDKLAGEFLSQCDLVKFAKHRPSSERCEYMFKLAFQIVEGSRQRQEVSPENGPQAGHPGSETAAFASRVQGGE